MISTNKTQTSARRATRTVALALACAATLGASVTARAQQQGAQKTTLRVDVAVERTELTAGPYARYSQKYLGVVAPLADKVTYRIKSVDIFTDGDSVPVGNDPYMQIGVDNTLSHMSPEQGFPRLTVDRLSAVSAGAEENARMAAQKIFDIRRIRFDLIMGNVGENVFGGGLGSALGELGRLEEEYLSLFLGRQVSRVELKNYNVTPTSDQTAYTVFRFSEAAGPLAQSDLSGEPVVLELRDAGNADASTVPAAKPSSRAVPVVVPAEMECRVVLGGAELASSHVSVQQFGRTVYVTQ